MGFTGYVIVTIAFSTTNLLIFFTDFKTTFEKSLFSKTSKANSEVLMLDGLTVLYRSNVDLFFYVLGGPQVNFVLCFQSIGVIFSPFLSYKSITVQ